MTNNQEEKNTRLKQLRKKLGLTQQEMSEILGIVRSNLSKIEMNLDGRSVPKDTYYILNEKFGLNREWWETGSGEIFSDQIKTEYTIEDSKDKSQIPMYNLPVSAGEVEIYDNPNDVKIVGYLNIPGAHKDSIALPAYGHSMYPTIANGDWAVSRPISNPKDIVWGEVYYIEWSDYKMYKRLLYSDNLEEAILWSDNQLDLIGNRPKYSPITVRKDEIRQLRLVTEILKKPNY